MVGSDDHWMGDRRFAELGPAQYRSKFPSPKSYKNSMNVMEPVPGVQVTGQKKNGRTIERKGVDTFGLSLGVPQEPVLSLTLWNILYDNVLKVKL